MSESGPRDPRRVFETELHPLPREERLVLARSATGETLGALCLDPDPAVVLAVLQNPSASLTHARLIAHHHRNPVGLEGLARSPALLNDSEVQRALLRNPQTSEVLLQRLLAGRPLVKLHALVTSRELTDRARRSVREAFRRAFQTTEAEARVRLIVTTEGRCLPMLVGIPLGQKAAALLSSTTIASMLLAQNLATWSATPPNVLAHLMRQAVVQRASHLRQLVLRHPNCPSQLKRG